MRHQAQVTDSAMHAGVAAHLTQHGVVSPALLARAAEVAAATGEPVHHALVRLGLIGEAELAKAFAACLGLPLARPTDYPALPVEHPALPPRFLEAHRLLPLALDEHRLTLAMADPLDGFAVRALAMATGRQAEVRVAVPAELEAAFKEAFGTTDATEAKLAPDSPAAVQEDDVGRLRDLAREAPVVRLVDRLLLRAVEARASDVHIEPHGVGLRVRYRIDGDLEPVEPPPAHLRAAVISRLKIMAGLDIAERRLPQDGRIRLTAKGRAIDLRVSTIPFQEGEGVVLRLLDKGALVLDLDALGYAGDGLARLRRMIAQPNGIVLVTGPTGSGKTSTLYAALGERMSPAIKLVTVEDPVEYELPRRAADPA
ncbi:MAG TPA: ATPase, T2SS/T4P/T4SS family [Geminicoccus sp.]|nr:ATPase, T2SS/T4P/T4SS family [Geminicoccus sp.]